MSSIPEATEDLCMNGGFMIELYDRLHGTPIQRKLREVAPMPVGVVLIRAPDMTAEEMRSNFRLIKELGFTWLEQVMACPGTPEQD